MAPTFHHVWQSISLDRKVYAQAHWQVFKWHTLLAVRVKHGKISGVALLTGSASQANLSAAAALKFGLRTILDFGDLIISPGLIDTHVHFNEPGREAWEGVNPRIERNFSMATSD